MLRSVIVAFGFVLCSFSHGAFSAEDKVQFQNFKDFSMNLLYQSDMDEFSTEKGAAMSSPFGVGYMLANVNEKVWNISTSGIASVLKTSAAKTADEYAAVITNLQQGNVSTSSTLFSKELNASSPFPAGSQKMQTEMKYTNYIGDWKGSWFSINDKISEQTNGKLDDQLVPKGGWWGGAFYHFTMGAFVNTFHFKSEWANKWVEVVENETRKFSDGLPIQVYETMGEFPYVDSANFSAISFDLKSGNKSLVMVLPKVPLSSFLQNDLYTLFSKSMPYPASWAKKTFRAQVPSLNITLLDQHYKKLEMMGINYTFCVDETNSIEVMKKKGPYFMSPIVQAHHFQFSPEFFEVATATGASINSEEKLKQEPADYDVPSSEDSVVSGSDSSEEEPTTYSPDLQADDEVREVGDSTESPLSADVQSFVTAASAPVVAIPSPSTTPASLNSTTIGATPEARDPNSFVFDKPFFWYLADKEMGPIFFGAIQSVATYKKEYGLENDEDLWLFDAYKTLLWNCP